MSRQPESQSELNLQTRAMAHSHDPEASWLAAEHHVESGKTHVNQALVLKAIVRWPNRTADELAANMAAKWGADALCAVEIRRRRCELAAHGNVVKSGQRKCRKAGTTQTTWRVK